VDEIVSPFVVRYDGYDADAHILEASAFGESVAGAARLYTAVAHYCVFGIIPKGKYRKDLACYARPTTPGSVDQILFIAPAVASHYAIYAAIYNKALSLIFGKVVDSLKNIWTQPRAMQKMVETLAAALTEQARINADVQSQLAAGLIKANDNLALLQSRLIETLPQLAETTRPHAAQLVRPVGKSCREIIQFSGSDAESRITEADAEVIRGTPAMEVDPMTTFKVNRINEINLSTGHCILDVEGVGPKVIGKITDPALGVPDNVYTRALNEHSSCVVEAKAVKRNDVIVSLYISNAN
jgi:hypothetical protein